MDEESAKKDLSRRRFLEIGSAALASASVISAENAQAQAQESAVKAEKDQSATIRGPQNAPLTAANHDSVVPPITDHGNVPPFKYPFSYSHRRTHEGGWARQVTIQDLPVSTTLAGVNMRLTAGGIRELHWHTAAEWALMLYGNARITALDADGKGFVSDVKQGDLWNFPSGIPHSIQGLGPDGCEFLLVFDEGGFSEYDTILISDLLAHTPRSVVAKNFGVSEAELDSMPKGELFIFQADLPGSLEEDRRAVAGSIGLSPVQFDFRLMEQPPAKKTKSGDVRIVDSTIFKASTTIAAALVTLHPGGLREIHWHPNADEWQYYVAGKGRMTVFAAAARARTMDFEAGDVGYVQKTLPHYIENTGDTDLIFLEMFKSGSYQDISLSEWISHTPPELIAAHLHLAKATIEAIPKKNVAVMPV
jgi:oxalate decarboxylase